MERETFEVEAPTLEQARAQARAKVPAGRYVVEEEVIRPGGAETVRGIADSVERAAAQAQAKVPPGARVVGTRTIQEPGEQEVTVAAESEQAARRDVQSKLEEGCEVVRVELDKPGSRGLLGLGRRPNEYRVVVRRSAIVELEYTSDAKIRVVVGDRPASWEELVRAGLHLDKGAGAELLKQFPYEVLFVLWTAELDNPSYYSDLPFGVVTDAVVERARRYVDNPPVPGLLAAFGAKLDPDRYFVAPDGGIARKSYHHFDMLIAQVASCLRGRGTFSSDDHRAIADAAYDAIIHYSRIPIVRYFFSLPYLDSVKDHKTIVRQEALITVYKGVEGLLLELWDELGEGEVITDEMVISKVRKMMTG